MAKPDGGPAFPQDEFGGVKGMSLRDYFAGQALASQIQALAVREGSWSPQRCVELAYEFADAMLAEREKGQ